MTGVYMKCNTGLKWVDKHHNPWKFQMFKLHSRSSRPQVFLGKVVLRICSKFTGEHTCQFVISIKLQSNFIEITLGLGWSPINLLHIIRTPFLKNISARLLVIPILSRAKLSIKNNQFQRIWFCILLSSKR